ncbi:MAG TPA: nitronate monooxygenase [Nocardioidaceae bacterium]|nr:nitronate monooxygenase [Nocardioidaceae bacterium]
MNVTLGQLGLDSPVMVAAGCGGVDLGRVVDLTKLGASVTRTITLDPVSGPTGRRLAETPSGLLTDLGWENQGLQAFLATELPQLAQQQVRTVVSVAGHRLSDYAELARRAGGAPGVAAVEVSFFDDDAFAAAKALAVVRRDVPPGVSVLAKLPIAGSDAGSVVDWARELARCGPDGLVVGHPHRGVSIDPISLRGLHGRLSGPATAPLALEAVWRVHAVLPDVPLVGVGGIRRGDDALAMLAAGATAVQVGTALLHDPSAAHRVQSELTASLDSRGLKPADVVGIAHRGGLP